MLITGAFVHKDDIDKLTVSISIYRKVNLGWRKTMHHSFILHESTYSPKPFMKNLILNKNRGIATYVFKHGLSHSITLNTQKYPNTPLIHLSCNIALLAAHKL